MELYLVYPLLAALLLIGIKSAPKGEFYDESLPLSSAKCLQGFCVVAVILHHVTQALTNFGADYSPLGFFNDTGTYFVSVFFFCSGFGLIKSLLQKPNYLDGFLPKRLITLLVPFYLANIIYLTYYAVLGRPFSLEVALEFLGLRLINGDFWYLAALVTMYFAFYFIFRNSKNERLSYLLMLAFTVIYVLVCMIRDHGDGQSLFQGEWWFDTVPSLLAGMLWARYDKQIRGFLQKRYVLSLVCALVLTVLFYFADIWALGNVGYYNGFGGMCVCFVIQQFAHLSLISLIMLALMKARPSNALLGFLGGLTLEIYLIHRLILELLISLALPQIVKYVAIIVLSVGLAFCLRFVVGKLKKPLLQAADKRMAQKQQSPIA